MKPIDRYVIGPGLRIKLREVVDRHDATAIGGGGGPKVPVRTQESPRGGDIRVGRISATWAKNATASVEQVDRNGDPFSPSITFDAKNWFAAVTVASGYKRVACAFAAGTWFLIAAECD